MNSPNPGTQFQTLNTADDGDEINLLELLDVVLDSRWLIAAVFLLVVLLGGAYAVLSTPVYEANTLIQVEESKGANAGSLLGDAASLFEIRSPATAEIEILRSRLVVGQAVQNLQLDLNVTPKYLPVVGRWLASRAKEPSPPGFAGLPGYVTGNESLKVITFDVPQAFVGKQFSVVLTQQGYSLMSPDEVLVAQGVVGQPLEFSIGAGKGMLLVAEAAGKPGAEFYLSRYSRLSVIQQLQSSLVIAEQGRQSGVIRASVEGDDPARIARVLNEIGTLYVRQNVQRKSAEAEKSLGFLDTFLPQLKRQLEESENKFSEFRNRNGTFDLGNEAKVVLDQAVKLQTTLLELQQKKQELQARFTAEHPSVQTINAQIASVNGQLGMINSRVKVFPNVEQDMLRLTRDVKVNNELYVSLLNSLQQLRLVKEGKIGNVRVVDVAVTPERPVKPQRSLIVALAAVLGLFAGIVLAFIRNSLRPGIKDAADIEQRIGLSVFATVPHSEAQLVQAKAVKAKLPGAHLLAIASPKDPAVESLRSLRTALQFAMLEAANNIVLMTGPTPGIGKSFTSVNFAAVLGAAGKKVLLIDADLRKGHLNQFFGLPRQPGLSELISGTAQFANVLRKQVVPNVDFLSTGQLPPNPAELLTAAASQSLIQQIATAYDLVIIDTAPLLAASDTAILAPLAGVVFLVARAEVTSLGELQECSKRLAQSGVQPKGVVFNDVNISKRRYGYGNYKYGGYRYTNYKY